MIEFEKYKLKNGLTVIVHVDTNTPMAVTNVLYDVGAKDELEDKTGFAHLFEHLMFGGSMNIPEFDTPLQNAGGENNAFTSNDITNYYDVLPAENYETSLWLESDRMLSLSFSEKSLEVQRNVVIEEFKQRYLNEPYGDVWLELRPLAYKEHPYKWATIGKKIEHIEQAKMVEVKDFFHTHYHPANAILCVAGNIDIAQTKSAIDKWFSDIPRKEKLKRQLMKEPIQEEYRKKIIERDVPTKAFYFAFKMCGRKDEDYHAYDLISDILGREKSSLLYKELIEKHSLVDSISAYILGSIDEGLLIISGKIKEGIDIEHFESFFWKSIEKFKSTNISEYELQSLVNKIKTAKAFQDQSLLNRAMALCYFELIGDASEINKELDKYDQLNTDKIESIVQKTLVKTNCSVLFVKQKHNE